MQAVGVGREAREGLLVGLGQAREQVLHRRGEQRLARGEVVELGAARDPGPLGHGRGGGAGVAALHQALEGRVEHAPAHEGAALLLAEARAGAGELPGRHGAAGCRTR